MGEHDRVREPNNIISKPHGGQEGAVSSGVMAFLNDIVFCFSHKLALLMARMLSKMRWFVRSQAAHSRARTEQRSFQPSSTIPRL